MSVQGKRKSSSSLGVDLQDVDQQILILDDLDVEVESTDLVGDLRASRASSERTSSISEDNLDYDSVSSPGGSSTASGPIYIRPAGFDHHAHEIVANDRVPLGSVGQVKAKSGSASNSVARSNSVLSRHSLTSLGGTSVKKKKGLLSADFKGQDNGQVVKKKVEPISPISHTRQIRPKPRKDPLPMKQRALPQSFWQQPNQANPQPPGIVNSALPPLPLGGEDAGDITPVEEVTVPFFHPSLHAKEVLSLSGSEPASISISSNTSSQPSTRKGERVITAANTDLLFSLFNSVEEEEAQRRIHVVRRGRPKKNPNNNYIQMTRVARDDDPCLNSVSVESILPLIPDRGNGSGHSSSTSSGSQRSFKGPQGTQVIKIMSISSGDRSVELPSLNIEHNYPNLLSELVMKL